MRSLVVMALCLLLPLQGFAGVQAFKPPCPMHQGAAGAGMHEALDKHACCHDEDTRAKTGQPCKAGSQCQSGSVAMAVPAISNVSFPVTPFHLSALKAAPADSRPVGVWRPPTLI